MTKIVKTLPEEDDICDRCHLPATISYDAEVFCDEHARCENCHIRPSWYSMTVGDDDDQWGEFWCDSCAELTGVTV